MNRRTFLKGLMGSAASAIAAPMIAPRVLITAQLAAEIGAPSVVADPVRDIVWVESAWVRFARNRPMAIRGYLADFEEVRGWLSRQERDYCDAIPKMIELAEASL